MTNLLSVSDLSVTYRSRKDVIRALDRVSLTIPSVGYTLGVVGESGSGKTTLGMSLMNAIEPPGKITSGVIDYEGQNILSLSNKELKKYRWKEVSMVYQSAMNSLNPVKKISDHIIEVITFHTGVSKKEARVKTLQLLSSVGIKAERADDYPHEFSGGMRQRVIIALALALSPKLLIADEPTSALDVVTQKQILKLLMRERAKNQLSLLFITHDILLLRGLVENIAVMYAGEIMELGPISEVLKEPLHPYTEMLLSTLLTFESVSEGLGTRDRTLQNESRAVIATNACKYSGSCKYAFDRCSREAPKLREVKKGRFVSCHKFS
ncbi:MAG: ABC transporter ATP-binding protein [Nitrososphaerales archaeon]